MNGMTDQGARRQLYFFIREKVFRKNVRRNTWRTLLHRTTFRNDRLEAGNARSVQET